MSDKMLKEETVVKPNVEKVRAYINEQIETAELQRKQSRRHELYVRAGYECRKLQSIVYSLNIADSDFYEACQIIDSWLDDISMQNIK